MSAIEHIAKWHGLFSIIRNDDVVLLAVLIISAVRIHYGNDPPLSKFRLYSKYQPETKLSNYLLMAFSQGILNPRLYA